MLSVNQQNINFLWNTLVVPIIDIISSNCKRKPKLYEEDFLPSCRLGNLEKVKALAESFDVNLNEGLIESAKQGQVDIARYLISKGATDLDSSLKVACQNNNSALAELLVQKGANIVVGLRVSKSPNITRMLYRYEQNSELIN
jgi:hypothetical protein